MPEVAICGGVGTRYSTATGALDSAQLGDGPEPDRAPTTSWAARSGQRVTRAPGTAPVVATMSRPPMPAWPDSKPRAASRPQTWATARGNDAVASPSQMWHDAIGSIYASWWRGGGRCPARLLELKALSRPVNEPDAEGRLSVQGDESYSSRAGLGRRGGLHVPAALHCPSYSVINNEDAPARRCGSRHRPARARVPRPNSGRRGHALALCPSPERSRVDGVSLGGSESRPCIPADAGRKQEPVTRPRHHVKAGRRRTSREDRCLTALRCDSRFLGKSGRWQFPMLGTVVLLRLELRSGLQW